MNKFASYPDRTDECSQSPRKIVEDDLGELSDDDLAATYVLEAASHARIIRDVRKGKCQVDPAFKSFRSFLKHVGPIPDRTWTLDRLDPKNPTYGPGLVRWATKREQANNRTNTVHLRGPDGTVRPLTEWARRMQVQPAAIRRRLDRGWTHEEAISGKRSKQTVLTTTSPIKAGPKDDNPWPAGITKPSKLEKAYETFRHAFSRRYPGADRRHASRAVFSFWVADVEGARALRALENKYPDYFAGGDVPADLASDRISIFLRHVGAIERDAKQMMAPTPGALQFARSLSKPERYDLMAPVRQACKRGGKPTAAANTEVEEQEED